MNERPKNTAKPNVYKRRLTVSERIEWCWLLLINISFRRSPDKHKAYYEYRLTKKFLNPF